VSADLEAMFSTTPRERLTLATSDFLEIQATTRSAMVNYRYGLLVKAGAVDTEKPAVLSRRDLERFDDLSALYGISPVADLHREGEEVTWETCNLLIQALLHILQHGFLPAAKDTIEGYRKPGGN
jgi:hypothetical protein